MLNTDKNLDEIIALPIGLKPLARLDGKLIYGSEKLNTNFLKAISKSKRTSPHLAKFSSMINSKRLIVCFKSKTLPGFIQWKVFAPSGEQKILGFYDPPSDKIFIFISSNLNMFAYVSNNFLSKLLIHESIHMFADVKRGSFISLFKADLINYYKHLWTNYFKMNKNDVKDETILNVVNFIFKNFELKSPTGAGLKAYFTLIFKEFFQYTTVSKDEFAKLVSDYLLFATIFVTDMQKFISSIPKYKHVFTPIYTAYKEAFGLTNLTTLCVQELLYPSEVIAIMSEGIGNSRINTAIKNL